jgi:hypothetical protein
MVRRLTAITLVLALLGAIVLAPASALAGQPSTNPLGNIPIEGTFPGGTFEGTFTITRFLVQQGQLLAQGTLTGQLFDTAGNVIGQVTQTVRIPVTDISAQGVCEVLFLNVGPITLRLLGLNVFIDEITIRITADPAGGILGELLCAIADGFDLGNLADVARLLNQLLALLQ